MQRETRAEIPAAAVDVVFDADSFLLSFLSCQMKCSLKRMSMMHVQLLISLPETLSSEMLLWETKMKKMSFHGILFDFVTVGKETSVLMKWKEKRTFCFLLLLQNKIFLH